MSLIGGKTDSIGSTYPEFTKPRTSQTANIRHASITGFKLGSLRLLQGKFTESM